jgi:CheY-like chemotaxis protein
MMLPDMDGLQLLGHLHEDTNVAHIPVVVLSASPEIDLAEIAQAAGAETFLTKPVRLQTLIDVIQRYTSG